MTRHRINSIRPLVPVSAAVLLLGCGGPSAPSPSVMGSTQVHGARLGVH
jgi:hypothetical protein